MKLENDIKQLKYEVLRRVAEQSFRGTLEEDKDDIPYEIIPGNQPRFRCCVYKEREVIRQRVRLASGKKPSGVADDGNVIAVIPAACEGCPIKRFRVTENCQKCMAKSCMAACPFGAITMSGHGAYIDQTKCKECGRCAQACPYNAIADLVRPCKRGCPVSAISSGEDKVTIIDADKCIACGNCLRDCPFGAISDVSMMVDVIGWIQAGEPVYAIPAPSLEGHFGMKVSMNRLKGALVKLGFTAAVEVALGADAVARHEAHELKEAVAAGQKMTSSCCPAFYNLVAKHFPQLLPRVSGTVSPMVAAARWLRAQNPKARVVFIGPCVAKKSEMKRPGLEGELDAVLTAEELLAMLDAQGIEPEKCEPVDQDGSLYGRKFAQLGGVTGAVMHVLEEEAGEVPPISAQRCDGAIECKKALQLMAAGKLPVDFIEGMSCMNGCINGPVGITPVRQVIQARTKLGAETEKLTVSENLTNHSFDGISLNYKR